MFLKKTIPSILVKIPLLNCGLIVSLGLATLNAAPRHLLMGSQSDLGALRRGGTGEGTTPVPQLGETPRPDWLPKTAVAPLLASAPGNLESSQGQLTFQAIPVKQAQTPQSSVLPNGTSSTWGDPKTGVPPERRVVQMTSSNSPLSDGIYLYGQSEQPEQLGQEYLIFKVYQGKVVGAFYLPQSEFNCFYGTLNARSMNLSIVDPNDKTTSPYSIGLRELSPVAAGDQTSRAIGLDGYHNIQTPSENDQHILDVCLEEHQ